MVMVVMIGRLFRVPASDGVLLARWIITGVSWWSGLSPVSHQLATGTTLL
jgi:hypothetical protein